MSMTKDSIGNDSTQLENVNILYIEDNVVNRLLMKKILKAYQGYNYSEAFTGIDGIDAALEIKPNIILLDINLPDMDGYEVLSILSAYKELNHVKIIAVSANAMDSDIEKSEKVGFFAYITKPINQKLLIETIDRALQE